MDGAGAAIIGRSAELHEIDRLLDQAAAGTGGMLVFVGPTGAGKTTLAAASVAAAGRRGLPAIGGTFTATTTVTVWAQVLTELGAPDPADVETAIEAIVSGPARLIVLDNVDQAGPEGTTMLEELSGRVWLSSAAIVLTATAPLGIGRQMPLRPLGRDEVAALTGPRPAAEVQALWVASGGMPGAVRTLLAQLPEPGTADDPLARLALGIPSTARFLDVDVGLVRLLELTAEGADSDLVRARLQSKLARELLGDGTAAARRRRLIDESLRVVRAQSDQQAIAEVLDARLYALWDADAKDRLATAQEIVQLAEAAGDQDGQRKGLFWRFVSLMEFGRVAEAELALAAFERSATAAGDAAALVMGTARHAMLAILRGRFDDADTMIDDVAQQGARIGLPDAGRLVETLRGAMWMLRGDPGAGPEMASMLYRAARQAPGQLFEATAARALVAGGRSSEAAAELQRLLPRALTGSGPRWLGAMADLADVAAATVSADAAAQLYDVLEPFGDRLVVWAGANTVTGPVSHYLGLLAIATQRWGDAVSHLRAAVAMEEDIGALPWLACSLTALVDALTARAETGDLDAASDARRRARTIAENLGMSGLLDRMAPPTDAWSLTFDALGWLLQAGDEQVRLPDGRGPRQLRALLRAPHRDISALDLAAGGAGLQAPSTAELLDAAALTAYRHRLQALTTELDAADLAGNAAASSRLAAERDALLDQLRRATGLGGRVRQASAEAERARVNVTRTLRATLDRVAATAPRAAAHLQASIRTGLSCRYDPTDGGPSGWHF